MENQWNKDYDRLLEKAIAEGRVKPLRHHDERRDSPRFEFSEDIYHSEEATHRKIIDLSKTGYAFHAEKKYSVGEEAPLTIRDAFEAHAKVVSCEMEETDSGFLEFKYRVCCQFTNPEHGMIIILLLFEDSTVTGEMPPSDS